jgi:hypothetical protein
MMKATEKFRKTSFKVKKRTVLERVTSSEREKAWYYYSSDGWIVPACSGHCDATSP